ncbi:transposase [Streptomyces mirabilis]|uniref:transposase n=1 Tax=Streptomyces mirabilis TaxID=68239 RepID=UPI0036C77D29
MLVRDRLDVLFEDEEFADLYPSDGRPGFSPGQLALVSVLQFAEDLSDRAAAQAVRTRIDWKYALGLELEDTGFDYSLLCDFRARLVEGDAADRMLQVMLKRLTEAGLLKSGGRQRTDATYVLAAVRRLSRLELAGESLRAALEELAEIAPEWLQPLIDPEWDKRYGRRIEIRKVPGGPEAVIARAEVFGRDGQKVLAALWAPDAPGRLRTLPQVEVLRQVWVHHYYWDEQGQLRWRDGHALPPASLRFDSPYDTDAHYCTKNGTEWSGYRVHYTETCEEQRPGIVVHVATTIAPVQDGQLTEQIHDDLAQTALAPAEHVVDAAYIAPAHVQRAQPGTLRINGHEYLQFRFAKADCLACPDRHPCTASATRPRSIALLPQPLHEIQVRNRLDQQTEEWQRRYAVRAGIEATLSQTVRSNGLRLTRYRGLAKTHVQHVLTAMACNLTRTADWIAETPRGRTRSSRFHTLCTAAAGCPPKITNRVWPLGHAQGPRAQESGPQRRRVEDSDISGMRSPRGTL